MILLRFVFGAIIGSVANALVYRLPRGLSWSQGRSRCPKCHQALAWYDLLPLVSFLILGGKCRSCHKPISLRYLVIELFMVVGFLWLPTPLLWALWFVTIIIAFMDWETMLVSDWLVVIGLVLAFLINWPPSKLWLWGLLLAVGLIGGIWALSRGRAMGFGDVEIVAVLALWLGWPGVGIALWVAFVSGAIVGVGYLLGGKKRLQSQIAFGPFLILGGWAAYLLQWMHVLPF